MKSHFEREVQHLKSFPDFGSNAWFRRLGGYLPSGSPTVKANALYNLLRACDINPHLVTGTQLMQIRNIGKKFAKRWDSRMKDLVEERKLAASEKQTEQILLLRRIAGSLETIERVLCASVYESNQAKCPALSPEGPASE